MEMHLQMKFVFHKKGNVCGKEKHVSSPVTCSDPGIGMQRASVFKRQVPPKASSFSCIRERGVPGGEPFGAEIPNDKLLFFHQNRFLGGKKRTCPHRTGPLPCWFIHPGCTPPRCGGWARYRWSRSSRPGTPGARCGSHAAHRRSWAPTSHSCGISPLCPPP